MSPTVLPIVASVPGAGNEQGRQWKGPGLDAPGLFQYSGTRCR